MDSEAKWASRGNPQGVMETAKEELEILESQHPNRFHSLKKDLRAFIESQNNSTAALMPVSCPTTATQESSSRAKKRKRFSSVVAEKGRRTMRNKTKGCKSTDAVMERAQQCLYKIHHLKTTLLM